MNIQHLIDDALEIAVVPSFSSIGYAALDPRRALPHHGVTDIADSYALTLRAWRQRFMARLDEVRLMGFDERFVRMWEYCLALSEAGFATGVSQDLQIVLQKRRGIG